jgi:integrase
LPIESVSADLTWNAAFERWIDNRVVRHEVLATNARYISERTEWDYRQYARAIAKFFGPVRLRDIHAGHLREYHRGRAFCDHSVGAWDRPAGANRIRKEIGLLVRVMKSAGAWSEELDRSFEPLAPVHNDVPRAMSPDEQETFLRVAGSRQRWALIYCYSVVALQSTASTNELRGLRLADIDMTQGFLQVRSATAKNKYRIRTIPIATPEGQRCLGRLLSRAKQLGSERPEHYLFPMRISRCEYDPTRPMSDSGLKKLWEEVRDAAGMPWVRPYDLRHSGLTRMAESGVPVHVMMAYAGHMSMRMQQHYVSVSSKSMREWAQLTWEGGRKKPVQSERPRGALRKAPVVF